MVVGKSGQVGHKGMKPAFSLGIFIAGWTALRAKKCLTASFEKLLFSF
jgi:hypothetical protein